MLDLGLEDDIVVTGKDSPAAINRYIYYPDHIVRMPGSDPRKGLLENLWINGKVLLTEPVLQGFFKALLEEPIQSPKSNMNWNQDESISSFVGRRLNKTVADNVVSALYHGIYAGDIEKLSAHTILGFYCELEKSDRRVLGSLLQMARERKRPLVTDDLLAMHSIAHLRSGNCWRSCSQLLRGASTFTLRKGLNQLVEALKLRLESSGKVEILTGNSVDGIAKVANGDRSEMRVGCADLLYEQ
jgi:protoporphyrinogen/coproporphyrinogen III oxidase